MMMMEDIQKSLDDLCQSRRARLKLYPFQQGESGWFCVIECYGSERPRLSAPGLIFGYCDRATFAYFILGKPDAVKVVNDMIVQLATRLLQEWEEMRDEPLPLMVLTA